ncbi:MAG TPA: hypothetical protein VN416_06315, partial [Desulfomonilia bacterium]|nr:hypothetical protein [Desulfomonilia bacterium]
TGYSLYALHAPLVYALLIIGVPWPMVGLFAVLFGIVMFMSYENPFIRLGKKFASSWNTPKQPA